MLFFLVSKLHLVEVMYQYSLSWFIQLFAHSVEKSRVTEDEKEEEFDPNGASDPTTPLKSGRESLESRRERN